MHIQSVADADYTFINIVARWPGIDSSSPTRSYGAIVIWQLTWSNGKLRVGCCVIVPIHLVHGPDKISVPPKVAKLQWYKIICYTNIS